MLSDPGGRDLLHLPLIVPYGASVPPIDVSMRYDAGDPMLDTAALVVSGDPAELAKRHSDSGADEIVLLYISAAHQRRATLLDTVRRRGSRPA